jgi:hypothetical protein
MQGGRLFKHRQFFDDLAKKLDIKHPQDWNSVKIKTVIENGGSFINRFYKGSVRRGKRLRSCKCLI